MPAPAPRIVTTVIAARVVGTVDDDPVPAGFVELDAPQAQFDVPDQPIEVDRAGGRQRRADAGGDRDTPRLQDRMAPQRLGNLICQAVDRALAVAARGDEGELVTGKPGEACRPPIRQPEADRPSRRRNTRSIRRATSTRRASPTSSPNW